MTDASFPENGPRDLHTIRALQRINVRPGVLARQADYLDTDQILKVLDRSPDIRTRVKIAYDMHSIEDVNNMVHASFCNPDVLRYVVSAPHEVAAMVSFWRDVNNVFGGEDRPNDYGFGFFTDEQRRGEAIVPDTVRAIMRAAMESFPVENFVAYCADDNTPSITTLGKLGLQPTDTVAIGPTTGWQERRFSVDAGAVLL